MSHNYNIEEAYYYKAGENNKMKDVSEDFMKYKSICIKFKNHTKWVNLSSLDKATICGKEIHWSSKQKLVL